jgi:hypothetical protein
VPSSPSAIEAALRLLPLARVLDSVHARRADGRATHPDRAVQERLARLARWPFKVLPLPGTCLRIALVQVAVLRRRGVPALVRFGVRRRAGDLEFHAWAECDGPIDDHAAAAGYRSFEPVRSRRSAATRDGRGQHFRQTGRRELRAAVRGQPLLELGHRLRPVDAIQELSFQTAARGERAACTAGGACAASRSSGCAKETWTACSAASRPCPRR